MKKMKDDHDHRQQHPHKLPTPANRIVYEYDFFDENRTGPKHKHVLPFLKNPPKEVVFPEILLNSPSSQESNVSGQNSPADFTKRSKTTKDDDYDEEEEAKKRAMLKGKKKTDFLDQESDDDEVSYSYPDEDSSSLAIPHITVKNSNPNSHEEEVPPPIPPQLDHPRLVDLIQEPPVLLFEKKLELSDVKHNQNRLLITGSERLMAYLTEEEEEKVVNNEKESVFKVITVDPNRVEYSMHLRKWPKMRAIVLNREWFKLVTNNDLQKGDTVQGWGYRLCTSNQFRLTLNFNRTQPK